MDYLITTMIQEGVDRKNVINGISKTVEDFVSLSRIINYQNGFYC